MSRVCVYLTYVHTIFEIEISVWVFVTLEKLLLLYWIKTEMNQTVVAGDVSLNYILACSFFPNQLNWRNFFRFLIRFLMRVRLDLIDKRDGYRFGLVQ